MAGNNVIGAALLFISVAALSDLRIALRGDGAPFDDAVMSEARELVKRVEKPGDVVVFSPLFRAREIAALDLVASSHLPPSKIRNARRVVLVERVDHAMFGFAAPVEVLPVPKSEGRIEVRVFEPPAQGEVVVWSLRENVRAGVMRIERNGLVTSRCDQRRGEGGFSCPGEAEWLYIADRTLRIGGDESPCVWAHPTTGGDVVFTVPAAAEPPPGRRLLAHVSGGLTDDAVRNTSDGAIVRVEVTQEGASKGQLTVANRIGFQEGTYGIDAGKPLELRVTTPHDGRRHFCLNLDIQSAPTEAQKVSP